MDISRNSFINLAEKDVARRVREAGTRVCVFPINGTRRWFFLEHNTDGSDPWLLYMQAASQRHIQLYKLFFEHGIDTLLTPIFGPDILERGSDYMRMAAPGMEMLVSHPWFAEFYRKYDVRVRFYGDYRKHLADTPYAYLSDIFDSAAERTASHSTHRLFYGVFAHDATETLAALSIDYFQKHGTRPDRRKLVELYYGEYIPPVDLFIGFDKFAAFDMPLLATGSEDLYFMVAPSPYLTREGLRDILYDHLVTRRSDSLDYSALTREDWAAMRQFYRANQRRTLGVGHQHPRLGMWSPLPPGDLTP
ncbi:MAG: diterpene synthase [Chloroflexi bacterium]|nr:diterpene synthase [Chloroflexota bacterium]